MCQKKSVNLCEEIVREWQFSQIRQCDDMANHLTHILV